jgi:hypothetical protein
VKESEAAARAAVVLSSPKPAAISRGTASGSAPAAPIRDSLLSGERLEQHAERLAAGHAGRGVGRRCRSACGQRAVPAVLPTIVG